MQKQCVHEKLDINMLLTIEHKEQHAELETDASNLVILTKS